MKTKSLLSALLGLATASLLSAADVKPAAPVEVMFVTPEKFTDAKDSYSDTEKGREAILGQLKDHLVSRGAKSLAAGQKLEIRVTEVDLAGDFEPWRGPNFQDVRVVKDVYPPRVDLEFRLLDADGKVVREGKRQLRELGFLMTAALPTSDSLRYEKEMLNDWLRQEFKPAS